MFNLDSYAQNQARKARVQRLEKTVTDFTKRKGIKEFKLSGAQNPLDEYLDMSGVKKSSLVKENANDQARLKLR